jgi:hypothetical protein
VIGAEVLDVRRFTGPQACLVVGLRRTDISASRGGLHMGLEPPGSGNRHRALSVRQVAALAVMTSFRPYTKDTMVSETLIAADDWPEFLIVAGWRATMVEDPEVAVAMSLSRPGRTTTIVPLRPYVEWVSAA